MSLEAGDALVRALHDHNPWWETGIDAFDLPRRHKSDFYYLARPDCEGDRITEQPLFGLLGRRGVGKTTLLHEYIHHRLEAGDPPERFLYLPFDADPLYQLQSGEQLRRAVRYYESRIRGRIESDQPQVIILDDVHRIEHPNKPNVDGWGTGVSDLVEDDTDRHVVVTASAEVQIERELERVRFDHSAVDHLTIMPEKFRDYIFTLYPDLEDGDTRVSPTSIRRGDSSLPATLESGDIEPLVAELRSKHEQVSANTDRIRSQVGEYLAMGGIISYERDGAVSSATELSRADYDRLRDELRDALYQQIPDFESIETIADLERLCAIAARNRGAEPLRYQELVDLFDVDRRTLADSYLAALSELFILTGVTEYDNSRPRSVRLFLRDPGLVTALSEWDAESVRNNFDREADLARLTAFDHTMRFSYGMNAQQGYEPDPSVQFWRSREGEVDFVFEVGDTPVPVGLAYQPRHRDETVEALESFREAYDVPIAFLIVGDTVATERPIEVIRDGVVTIPYWLYLLLC